MQQTFCLNINANMVQHCILALPDQRKAKMCNFSIWICTLWLGNVTPEHHLKAFYAYCPCQLCNFDSIGLKGPVNGVSTEVSVYIHSGLRY